MSKNIVVLDYGSGNIRSVQKGLQKVGANVVVSNDFERRDLICQIKEIKNVLKLIKKRLC